MREKLTVPTSAQPRKQRDNVANVSVRQSPIIVPQSEKKRNDSKNGIESEKNVRNALPQRSVSKGASGKKKKR